MRGYGFELEHRGVKLLVTRVVLANGILYNIKFSSNRNPIVITKSIDYRSNEIWVSIPEGRAKEAEEVGVLIDKYLDQEGNQTNYNFKTSKAEPIREKVLPSALDRLLIGSFGRPNTATISWLQGLNNDNEMFYLIEGYKLSFNKLLNAFLEEDHKKDGYCNIYVYPILFCLRHCVELFLKDTIRKYRIGLKIIDSTQIGFKSIHNISKLFGIVKELVHTNPPKYTEEIMTEDFLDQLTSTENLIFELSEIDLNSYAFRYPYKKAKEETDQVEFENQNLSIDLINIKTVGEKLLLMMKYIHSEAWAICSNETKNNLSQKENIDNLGF